MICDWPFLLQGLREVKGKAISGGPAEINVKGFLASPLVCARFHSFSLPFAEQTAPSVQATYKLL